MTAKRCEATKICRSIPECAVMLGVSPRLVNQLIRDVEIRSLKFRGRRLVPETAIASFITRRMRRAADSEAAIRP